MFSDNFLQTAFNKFMTDIRNIILLKYLKNKWTGSFVPEVADWSCPHCQQNIYGFKKRGKRKRIIKSSFGKLHYSLLQVTCRKCNKIFSPFPKLL
jgi:RNase P subunit RPR2